MTQNFRIFYATDVKTSEYFRAESNKFLNVLRGKSSSDLISVVQSFTRNGLKILMSLVRFQFWPTSYFILIKHFNLNKLLEFQVDIESTRVFYYCHHFPFFLNLIYYIYIGSILWKQTKKSK